MAHVENWGHGEVVITYDASVTADHTLTEKIIPTGAYLTEAAAGEFVTLREPTATGPEMKLTSLAGEATGMLWHKGPPWPVPHAVIMDWSESSFAGTVKVKITFV